MKTLLLKALKSPYRKYFDKEVAAIEKLKFETVVLPSVVEFMQIVGVAGITRLLLHPNEPKIGFVGKRS
jgi:hypothetical protein